MDISSAVFRHNDSLVVRDLAGEKVIIPIRGKVGDLNNIYTLNRVANDIWNLLNGQRVVSEIVNRMQQEYEVDPVILAADVRRLLGEMQEEGLIVSAAGGCN
ncbi:MAG: PqqD family protein [Terriglobales bacterium]